MYVLWNFLVCPWVHWSGASLSHPPTRGARNDLSHCGSLIRALTPLCLIFPLSRSADEIMKLLRIKPRIHLSAPASEPKDFQVQIGSHGAASNWGEGRVVGRPAARVQGIKKKKGSGRQMQLSAHNLLLLAYLRPRPKIAPLTRLWQPKTEICSSFPKALCFLSGWLSQQSPMNWARKGDCSNKQVRQVGRATFFKECHSSTPNIQLGLD
jgi:hypothetical protein